MRIAIILLTVLCFSVVSYGQLKLVEVKYSSFAKAEFEDAVDNEESAFQEFLINVNLPLKLKNGKTTLINSFSYGQVNSTLYNSPLFEGTEVDKTLQSVSYGLTLVQQISSKMNFLIRVKPTLASDFRGDLEKDDLLILGTAMVTRKFGSSTVLGAGLAYTTQTGEPLILPVIKVQHKNKRHNLDILLPSHIKYLHGLGARKKFSIGAKAELHGGNYGVTIDQFSAADPKTIDKLIYTRTNVGLLANARLYRVFNLELFGGYSINRQYRFEGEMDDSFEYDSVNGPFVSVAISLMPKRKEVAK